jgi:hypothetical protein
MQNEPKIMKRLAILRANGAGAGREPKIPAPSNPGRSLGRRIQPTSLTQLETLEPYRDCPGKKIVRGCPWASIIRLIWP